MGKKDIKPNPFLVSVFSTSSVDDLHLKLCMTEVHKSRSPSCPGV